MQLHTYPPKYSRGSQSWKYNKTFLFFFYHNFFFFSVSYLSAFLSLSGALQDSICRWYAAAFGAACLPYRHLVSLVLLSFPLFYFFSVCVFFGGCLFCIQSVAVSTDRRRFCLSRQTNNNFSHDPRSAERQLRLARVQTLQSILGGNYVF